MPKSNAHSGSATFLDDPPADEVRSPASRDHEPRPPRSARAVAEPDDEGGEPFLRARRRVPVRRGLLPVWARSRWGRLAFAGVTLAAVGGAVALVLATRSFLEHDPRFRIASPAAIQTMGNSQLTRADLLSVFGGDVGHNLFSVPLAKRRAALEQIPWVERATVMRVLPNQLRVSVIERTPIAFVEVRGRIELADVNGVLLDMSPKDLAAKHYSFLVVNGINPADPLAQRSLRMHLYQKFISDLDSTGEHISAQLSVVDLTDPEDVKATVPSGGTDLLLYFGQEDFLARWRNYQAHIAQWRQQYPKLASVDLRYEREVVLKMAGTPDAAPAAAPAPAATAHKAATEHHAAAEHHATSGHHPARHVAARRHVSHGRSHASQAEKHRKRRAAA
ncbi:MAG: FtsQ-type POTRA domain-containing protein [Acidobacteriaceae bacterium]